MYFTRRVASVNLGRSAKNVEMLIFPLTIIALQSQMMAHVAL